ncbi:MAG: T9SS type A sorting domain-containing protein [Crocinitomicaceae bacterium]|jgi:hypothetical protein|nr:T9SS type A sorting domain-containing protein [Crocinitomicaceae bacterium]MBT6029636.1 T9SS type A sorting domain-containing protein [Crocinitomicaceae bacterium]MBT6514499.1 T9SS type A sorting domain-containing protein [Crocinitomicaceae bacterium]
MKNVIILTNLILSCVFFNAQQLSNAGFENWDILTDSSPHDDMATSWNTVNSSLDPFTAGTLSPTCYQSSDVHSGAYSINLKSVSPPIPSFPVVNGIATSGSINTSTYEVEGGVSYVLRPDSLVGWYKSSPQTGDLATIEFVLKGASNDTIGWGRFESPTTPVSVWTRFSVPIEYWSSDFPVLAICLLSASDGFNAVAGSELWVDDLELVFNVIGLKEIDEEFNMYYSNQQLSWDSKLHVQEVSVFNIGGQLMRSFDDLTENTIDLVLQEGIYLVKIKTLNGEISKKLSVW